MYFEHGKTLKSSATVSQLYNEMFVYLTYNWNNHEPEDTNYLGHIAIDTVIIDLPKMTLGLFLLYCTKNSVLFRVSAFQQLFDWWKIF